MVELFYEEARKSVECHCGRDKREGYAFCYGCYRKLPKETQRELSRRVIDHDWATAYNDAVLWIDNRTVAQEFDERYERRDWR